jgi:hypothetical protein
LFSGKDAFGADASWYNGTGTLPSDCTAKHGGMTWAVGIITLCSPRLRQLAQPGGQLTDKCGADKAVRLHQMPYSFFAHEVHPGARQRNV